MAQYRKDEIDARLLAAARTVFAVRGFPAATIAEIARAAGISTGNVYRYYESKDALFAAAVPEDTMRRLRRLLFARVEALAGVADVDTLPANAPYHAISEELLDFALAHRMELVIALARADGTPYAGLAEDLAAALAGAAIAHFRGLRPGLVVGDALRFDVDLIYRAYVDGLARILARFDDAASLRAAIEPYARYHLAGLRACLGQVPAPATRRR